MSLGPLAFLNPWLLLGLIALPAIWWLLRTVPPRPQQIAFPPTRILAELENRESTPANSPWWLTLIRMLAAAALIFALADPILNPDQGKTLDGDGPVVLIVDNGWASAAQWAANRNKLDRLIDEAEQADRAIMVVPTASTAKSTAARIGSPADARAVAAAIAPLPFAPDRGRVIAAIKSTLRGKDGVSLIWLSDGIDHRAKAADFMSALTSLARGGSVTVITTSANEEALALSAGLGEGGKLTASVKRSFGGAREGLLHAFTARGQRLAKIPFAFSPGAREAKATFTIPLELRNQITRIEIAGERSAGAVSLLDARSQWHRVGLISGGSREEAQPLLAPLYYVQRALKPFSELVLSPDSNVTEGITNAFNLNSSILMLADIGTISGALADDVTAWVKKGGILVRFAGPRLEKGGDDLLPAALRVGGRSLGGALSWSTPQPLAPFKDDTPFAGLAIPKDVLINRQVLADPAYLGRKVQIWSRLKDGTPLVTARKLGDGEIILFHVTANSDWSNLPLSGLFVTMLKRITARGQLGGPAGTGSAILSNTSSQSADSQSANSQNGSAKAATARARETILPPVQVLSGFGVLKPPTPTAEAISSAKIFNSRPSAVHPPGYYGSSAVPRALNVIGPRTVLNPLPPLPSGITRRIMETAKATMLKPWLLAATLALIFADVIAVLILQAGSNLFSRAKKSVGQAAGSTSKAASILLATGLGLTAGMGSGDVGSLFNSAMAQTPTLSGDNSETRPGKRLNEQFILRATSKVTFGYVLTGNDAVDQVSREGLNGLSRNLRRRTSVEPGDPAGINIIADDIALFPVLYWPVLSDASTLPEKTLAKIDAYMKQGGMIIFDTKDFGQGIPTGFAMSRRGSSPLQRLLGKLDIPRLEPVPRGHVLTKSFYLLSSFPGRWNGGELWVEADAGGSTDGSRHARRADGVSSILVTSNDFAAAWAVGPGGRPLYPTVPGGQRQREMAIRTGVNVVMYALTGNYKADQVHIPALLERLGQ